MTYENITSTITTRSDVQPMKHFRFTNVVFASSRDEQRSRHGSSVQPMFASHSLLFDIEGYSGMV